MDLQLDMYVSFKGMISCRVVVPIGRRKGTFIQIFP